jgi:hypothetical protein
MQQSKVSAPSGETYALYEVFGIIFLVEIFMQQFFVRLSPYLFAINMGQETGRVLSVLGNITVDMSSLVGIVALVLSGITHIRRREPTLTVVGILTLVFGSLVLLMDTARTVLTPTEYSGVYGSATWFDFTTTLLVSLTLLSYGGVLASSTNPHTAIAEKIGAILLALASSTVATYFTVAHLDIQTPLWLVGLAYNLGINLIGLGVVAYAFGASLRLSRSQRILGLMVSVPVTLGVGYVFYGGMFSDKILELMWQTSFGTPLPLPQTLVYTLFLVFFVFAATKKLLDRDPRYAYTLMVTIIMASSVFLINSLLVYIESAYIAVLMLLDASVATRGIPHKQLVSAAIHEAKVNAA